MLLTILLFLGSAVAIYLACEFFVNGVEWVGQRLNMGQTATGTILAAFGTALPESVVTLVAVMFGTRWLAMLFGFAFFSHQVGGFLGVWLGGYLYERTGSYDIVWWLGVFFGVASALINWPIVEKPVERAMPAPATASA